MFVLGQNGQLQTARNLYKLKKTTIKSTFARNEFTFKGLSVQFFCVLARIRMPTIYFYLTGVIACTKNLFA